MRYVGRKHFSRDNLDRYRQALGDKNEQKHFRRYVWRKILSSSWRWRSVADMAEMIADRQMRDGWGFNG